ncbi:MAG: hypothetical protein HQK53_06675 [Oligoflexia bacterium]|nr:hypothetical protein [Oligoflexia bacterium]
MSRNIGSIRICIKNFSRLLCISFFILITSSGVVYGIDRNKLKKIVINQNVGPVTLPVMESLSVLELGEDAKEITISNIGHIDELIVPSLKTGKIKVDQRETDKYEDVLKSKIGTIKSSTYYSPVLDHGVRAWVDFIGFDFWGRYQGDPTITVDTNGRDVNGFGEDHKFKECNINFVYLSNGVNSDTMLAINTEKIQFPLLVISDNKYQYLEKSDAAIVEITKDIDKLPMLREKMRANPTKVGISNRDMRIVCAVIKSNIGNVNANLPMFSDGNSYYDLNGRDYKGRQKAPTVAYKLMEVPSNESGSKKFRIRGLSLIYVQSITIADKTYEVYSSAGKVFFSINNGHEDILCPRPDNTNIDIVLTNDTGEKIAGKPGIVCLPKPNEIEPNFKYAKISQLPLDENGNVIEKDNVWVPNEETLKVNALTLPKKGLFNLFNDKYVINGNYLSIDPFAHFSDTDGPIFFGKFFSRVFGEYRKQFIEDHKKLLFSAENATLPQYSTIVENTMNMIKTTALYKLGLKGLGVAENLDPKFSLAKATFGWIDELGIGAILDRFINGGTITSYEKLQKSVDYKSSPGNDFKRGERIFGCQLTLKKGNRETVEADADTDTDDEEYPLLVKEGHKKESKLFYKYHPDDKDFIEIQKNDEHDNLFNLDVIRAIFNRNARNEATDEDRIYLCNVIASRGAVIDTTKTKAKIKAKTKDGVLLIPSVRRDTPMAILFKLEPQLQLLPQLQEGEGYLLPVRYGDSTHNVKFKPYDVELMLELLAKEEELESANLLARLKFEKADEEAKNTGVGSDFLTSYNQSFDSEGNFNGTKSDFFEADASRQLRFKLTTKAWLHLLVKYGYIIKK